MHRKRDAIRCADGSQGDAEVSAREVQLGTTFREIDKEFARLVDVNIKGVYHVIRHFVPAMLVARRGVIINFSSGWGRSTAPEVAPYYSTKWAVEGITRALADELPAGMAAISLNPGIIHTDMLDSCFGGGAAEYPTAAQWANQAVPFLLELGPVNNGQPLTAPQSRGDSEDRKI